MYMLIFLFECTFCIGIVFFVFCKTKKKQISKIVKQLVKLTTHIHICGCINITSTNISTSAHLDSESKYIHTYFMFECSAKINCTNFHFSSKPICSTFFTSFVATLKNVQWFFGHNEAKWWRM